MRHMRQERKGKAMKGVMKKGKKNESTTWERLTCGNKRKQEEERKKDRQTDRQKEGTYEIERQKTE